MNYVCIYLFILFTFSFKLPPCTDKAERAVVEAIESDLRFKIELCFRSSTPLTPAPIKTADNGRRFLVFDKNFSFFIQPTSLLLHSPDEFPCKEFKRQVDPPKSLLNKQTARQNLPENFTDTSSVSILMV